MIYRSTPVASHATPRCEARRFNVRRIVVPGNTQLARVGRSCMAGSTFRRAPRRLTGSYLTRPWSLRLELTSWLEARSASTPCPLLLAGVHFAEAPTDCVVPGQAERGIDWHVCPVEDRPASHRLASPGAAAIVLREDMWTCMYVCM